MHVCVLYTFCQSGKDFDFRLVDISACCLTLSLFIYIYPRHISKRYVWAKNSVIVSFLSDVSAIVFTLLVFFSCYETCISCHLHLHLFLRAFFSQLNSLWWSPFFLSLGMTQNCHFFSPISSVIFRSRSIFFPSWIVFNAIYTLVILILSI